MRHAPSWPRRFIGTDEDESYWFWLNTFFMEYGWLTSREYFFDNKVLV